jgi:NAD-dependent dihydropyrimidine dehydrogenase PreA subunit
MERDQKGEIDVTFVCPRTGLTIRHWLRQGVWEDEYEAVTCAACSRLHFLSLKTGKLLGHENE